jgi:hypothetical protein
VGWPSRPAPWNDTVGVSMNREGNTYGKYTISWRVPLNSAGGASRLRCYRRFHGKACATGQRGVSAICLKARYPINR